MGFIAVMKADVEHVAPDGKKYYLAPFTFKDLADYVLWYQFYPLEVLKQQVKGLPRELADAKLAQALDDCINKKWEYTDPKTGEVHYYPLSWECPEVQESTRTLAGIRKQLHLSLRNKHPDLTENELDHIVMPHYWGEVLDKIYVASGLTFIDNEEEGNDEKGEETPNP